MKKILMLVIMTLFFSLPFKVEAATLSVSASKDKVKPNESVTFTIAINGLPSATAEYPEGFGSMRLLIKYDASKFALESASEQTSGTEVKNETNGQINTAISITDGGIKNGTIYKVVLKSLSNATTGTSSVTASSNDCWFTDGLTSIPVTTGSKTITHYTPSTDNTLKSLTVSGCTLNEEFSKDTTSYTCPDTESSSVNITAVANDKNAKITGNGKHNLKYGDNKLELTVVSESGAKKVYSISIKRTDNRNTDNTLSKLGVDGYNINFDTKKTEYSLEVENDVESIKITGKANNEKATITGLGTIKLKVGINNIKVVCKAENESIKTYTIKVTRIDKENVPSTTLTKLSYNKKEIKLEKDKKVYLIGIDNKIEKLDLIYETISNTTEYEVEGNESLKSGINIIKIKVSDTNCDDNTYTLIVNKNIDGTVISNLQDLKTIDKNIIINNKEGEQKITKEVFALLKDSDYKLIYNNVNEYDGLHSSIELDKNVEYTEDLIWTLTKKENSLLTYTTNLPKNINVKLYLGYVNDNNLKLYSLNQNNEYVLVNSDINLDNSYLEFTTNGDLEYILSDTDLLKENTDIENNEQKNEEEINIWVIIIPAIIVVLVLVIVIIFVKKTKNKIEVID